MPPAESLTTLTLRSLRCSKRVESLVEIIILIVIRWIILIAWPKASQADSSPPTIMHKWKWLKSKDKLVARCKVMRSIIKVWYWHRAVVTVFKMTWIHLLKIALYRTTLCKIHRIWILPQPCKTSIKMTCLTKAKTSCLATTWSPMAHLSPNIR